MEAAVTIERIALEPLPETYRASSTVRRRATVSITSKATGCVRSVHVVAGDHEVARRVLIDLEATNVRTGVARSRAGLDQPTERHGEAQSATEIARGSSARRQRDGFPEGRAAGLPAETSSIEGLQ
jgi:multidrug efflux pump subunit AcrA (membrane-fusion protein)